MVPYGWHVWRGETSARYRFKITKTLDALPDAGGIYVMVRRTFFFWLKPIYIGKASNLQGRHTEHERWPEARSKGATERHYMCIRSESERQRVEEDLIRKYKPKLNGMLVPRHSGDAPNHKKLRSGWMSPAEYWGLGSYKSQKRQEKLEKKRRKRIDNRRKPHKRAA